MYPRENVFANDHIFNRFKLFIYVIYATTFLLKGRDGRKGGMVMHFFCELVVYDLDLKYLIHTCFVLSRNCLVIERG